MILKTLDDFSIFYFIAMNGVYLEKGVTICWASATHNNLTTLGLGRNPTSEGSKVIHPDANHAQRCLTAKIGRELVH